MSVALDHHCMENYHSHWEDSGDAHSFSFNFAIYHQLYSSHELHESNFISKRLRETTLLKPSSSCVNFTSERILLDAAVKLISVPHET